MKQYLVQHPDGQITASNWPISENGIEGQLFEVDEADVIEVREGTKDFKIEDGQLIIIPSTKKAEREAQSLANQQALEARKGRKEALLRKLAAALSSKEKDELINLL